MSDIQTTNVTAVIRFTAGPDSGSEFEVRDEMVHIGQSLENQIQLTDPTIAEHEASIVFRNGRFAIYASRENVVSVDGNPLPSARWVWLPDEAEIGLGTKTVFTFQSSGSPTTAKEPTPAGSTTKSIPAPTLPERKTRSGKKGAGKSKEGAGKKNVARFITDQVGDPLVKLGEDGQLPELSLLEPGEQRKKQVRGQPQQSSSLLVYGAIGFSFLFSIMLLFLDPEFQQSSKNELKQARVDIQKFYGTGNAELKPYQILLREAQLAYSRQDRTTERRYYRSVLRMLTAEDNQGLIRLTDSREHDQELRDLLSILLTSDD